jgi:hypothetical protein
LAYRDDDVNVDPTTARSVEEFAACLRRLRVRAGSISYRALESWGKRHRKSLPRSTVLDALAGRRLPSQALVLAFVEACGVDPQADTRWLTAWNQLAERRDNRASADARRHDLARATASLAEILAALSGSGVAAPDVQSALTHALIQAERLLSETAAARREADQEIAVLRADAQRQTETMYARARRDIQQQRLAAQLARDVKTAGLRRIGARYLSELEWSELFAGVRELDIFVAYGQTWRNLHVRELAWVAQRRSSRIRVFLADPDDDGILAVLADRFGITSAELRSRIEATSRDYAALRRPDGAPIEIYYRQRDRVFSFYRFDDVAVVGLYSHARTRTTSVPVFVCAAPGELFQFISDELRAIQAESRPL